MKEVANTYFQKNYISGFYMVSIRTECAIGYTKSLGKSNC